jgi:tryptophan synthase beta subunit
MRDWVTNVADTYYVLGSAMGPFHRFSRTSQRCSPGAS